MLNAVITCLAMATLDLRSSEVHLESVGLEVELLF